MMILILISIFQLNIEYYRFEGGYTEFWYQIPVSQIFTPEQLESPDIVLKKYSYNVNIHNKKRNDSFHIEGIKRVRMTPEQKDYYIVDYLPVQLYPEHFYYHLEVISNSDTLLSEGKIEIPPDTILFYTSDLMLGKKKKGEFSCHNLPFIPMVIPEFSRFDTLFLYLEIYGLVPDSLYCNVKYHIIGWQDKLIFKKCERRPKYEVNQIDTLSISLDNLLVGEYQILVEIVDPALNLKTVRAHKFKIREGFPATGLMKFYYDIHFLISSNEYKKFCQLDSNQKEIYLKKFWSRHNYGEFEKRIMDADADFSTRLLKGRYSERGKFYINNGPPDEIETITMATWARPFEVWHYYAGGYDALFSDIKDDGNPRLIKILKPGEITTILESETREGDEGNWLFNIAPGTRPKTKKEEE